MREETIHFAIISSLLLIFTLPGIITCFILIRRRQLKNLYTYLFVASSLSLYTVSQVATLGLVSLQYQTSIIIAIFQDVGFVTNTFCTVGISSIMVIHFNSYLIKALAFATIALKIAGNALALCRSPMFPKVLGVGLIVEAILALSAAILYIRKNSVQRYAIMVLSVVEIALALWVCIKGANNCNYVVFYFPSIIYATDLAALMEISLKNRLAQQLIQKRNLRSSYITKPLKSYATPLTKITLDYKPGHQEDCSTFNLETW